MNTEHLRTARTTLRNVLANQGSRNLDEDQELRASWRRPEQERYLKIGAGACGEVYQMTGSECEFVAKRAKTEQYAQQLRDDYKWHLRIEDAVSRRANDLELGIRVPKPRDFVASSDEEHGGADWWRDHGDKFSASAETLPEVVLTSERVLPIPVDARHSLIALHCPESRQEAAKKDPGNVDCLIRVYLGKNRPDRRATSMVSMFGLRNFQMYADDFERVGLAREAEGYAISIARTLALLHWEVRCDANDVEFVLGGARENESGRNVELWLIDFNRVRAISMDAEGIRLATEAFMVNDRYYPRPLDGTDIGEKLWSTFRTAYLETSRRLQSLQETEGLAVEWVGLPAAFIDAVVQAQSKLLQDRTDAVNRAA